MRTAYERLVVAETPQPGGTSLLAHRAPLVGRALELAHAQTIWQAAVSGQARLLILAGDAGIGKTRLAEELLTWAGRHGVATANACCYAAEGDLAYGPVAEWLRTDILRRQLGALDPIWLSEVARLVPELLAERPDLPHPGPLTERWQRRRLFEALARALLVQARPLLLLVDDLHWCDSDTLQWIHFLLRYDPAARLLVVGTVRLEEAEGLETALADMRRRDQLAEMVLGPLSEAETTALAEQLVSQPFSRARAANLYAETEGNPLFIIERVRAGLGDEMTLTRRAPAPTGHDRLPAGVHAVIARRLRQITPAARELLEVAAVIGRSFTLRVLLRAGDGDEDALVRSLDELWRRRVVREQGENAYDFSHGLLRTVAYEGLSNARRRSLHRRVAHALEVEHAAVLDLVSGQIAGHYERGGQAEDAVTYYLRAADASQRMYASAEAIAHLQHALRLIAATPADAPQRAAAVHERLGDLLHLSGQSADAEAAYHRSRKPA